MSFIKTYEEWRFNYADNQDLPATNVDQARGYPKRTKDPEATDTLIFTPEDEYGYPNKIDEQSHGFTSHAIKHMWEFKHDFYATLIRKTKNILKNYVDDYKMKVIDRTGEIDHNVYEDEDIDEMSLYNIVNALDFINDKTFEKTQLTEVEVKLHEEIMRPLRIEYKKLIDYILANAVNVRDYRKDMGNKPIFFNGDQTGRYINYYDPNIKGLLITSMDKNTVYSLFKIARNSIFEYFNKLNPGSEKRRPTAETLGFLRTYGK